MATLEERLLRAQQSGGANDVIGLQLRLARAHLGKN